jgi:phospholipid transport system substrate-binding protein
MKKIAALLCTLFLVWPLLLHAQQEAMTTVKGHVDNVLKVLRNPALKGEKGESAKKAQIEAEADKLFDYVELSKRTLGLNWNRFSGEQRREFVQLYRSLLEETYIDRITAYTNERVSFVQAVPLGDSAVEVRSVVVTKTGEVPIYYRTLNVSGQWKVYDVIIEGVSLTANYRSQFREILANQSPQALLDTLRNRVGGRS